MANGKFLQASFMYWLYGLFYFGIFFQIYQISIEDSLLQARYHFSQATSINLCIGIMSVNGSLQ